MKKTRTTTTIKLHAPDFGEKQTEYGGVKTNLSGPNPSLASDNHIQVQHKTNL